MKRRRMLLAMVAAGALAVAGCGGGSVATGPEMTPNEEVRDVANRFSAAFGAADIKRACGYWGPAEAEDRPGTCFRIYGDGSNASYNQSFLTAKVQRVAVTGSTATVAYSNDTIAKLRRTPGGWRIDELGEARYYAGLEEEEALKQLERELCPPICE